MTVYVDALRSYPQKANSKQGQRWFGQGKQSCHLLADTDQELHEFAAKLGLRREWAQGKGMLVHYDLMPSKRAEAIKRGAVPMGNQEIHVLLSRRRAALSQST